MTQLENITNLLIYNCTASLERVGKRKRTCLWKTFVQYLLNYSAEQSYSQKCCKIPCKNVNLLWKPSMKSTLLPSKCDLASSDTINNWEMAESFFLERNPLKQIFFARIEQRIEKSTKQIHSKVIEKEKSLTFPFVQGMPTWLPEYASQFLGFLCAALFSSHHH